ncbi:MAG TPA: HAMP domain-containing sensor histidine kinase [Pedococcus sp.]|nr:HAMP domain-containing sensor histidine kinase [Pedococcus sp.]
MFLRPGGRWAGIRLQATLAAAGIVAVALVAASVALLLLLQNSLASTLQDTVTALLAEDAATLASGGLEGLRASETDRGQDTVLVQVVEPAGGLAYSSKAGHPQPVSALRPGPGQTLVTGRDLLPHLGDLSTSLVVAEGVDVGGAPYVLLASTALEPQEEAVTTTAVLLAAGIPLLTGLVAWVTWWRIGRALRSVDAITGQVERIEARSLSERVPVPATRDEVAHLATTMNAMLSRLESADTAQRRFVADASHELRSPLATLSASVEVADADPTAAAWAQLSPIVQIEVRRMARLVDDLLLLSRLDDTTSTPRRDDVDLDDLAGQEVRRLRQLSDLTVQASTRPVRVHGDPHQLAQVLRNLLDNAAVAARTTVRVEVQAVGDRAVVVVEDDGDGVPTRERERIFDRFVRLDESRSRRSGGSGLGLAITRRVVTAHQGTITVDGSSLGGARFTVALPLGRDESAADGPAAQDVGHPVVAEVDAADADGDHHHQPGG